MAHIQVKMALGENGQEACAIAHGRPKTDRQVPGMKMSKLCRSGYKCHVQMGANGSYTG